MSSCEAHPLFCFDQFKSGTEIVDTRLLWKQETVHKSQVFIWWSEVLDVRGQCAERVTESLVEELAAHTEEHQLTLSAAPDSVSKSDRVTKGGRAECTGLQEDILHGGLDEATLSQESSLRDSRKVLAG